MEINDIYKQVRDIPDFPKPGILFKDLTTVFKNGESVQRLSDELYRLYKDKGITKVAGIESRGFIMGSILAARLGAGFVPVRKPGKLPAETWTETFEKEYGCDAIEIHRDAIAPDDVVLLHDDLLATGGTMLAAYHLIQRFHPRKIYINFLSEIVVLNGRSVFPSGVEIETILKF